MIESYPEKFKIVATSSNGEKETYWYKYSEFAVDHRSWILFYLYVRVNWHSFKSDISITYNDKKIKENKEKYFELVQNFLNKVVYSNNFYLKGKGKRWNWKLDDIEVKEDTRIQGENNRKIFDLWSGSTISITTPNFDIDNFTDVDEYFFEKDLLNANFYLNDFIWSEEQPNSYLYDKEFVKRLDTMITKMRDENLRTFQNKDKIYNNIKNLTGIMLVEIENNFKHIAKELRKVVTTFNDKLTIAEYENIINFARMIRYIDSLQDPKNYNINGILQYFKNFFNENEYFKNFLNEHKYFKKPHVNSIFKGELAEIALHKEQGDYEKANDLKRTALLRFFKDNQKAIVDLFLENKILSVNTNKEMLKENQTVEIEDK